MYHIRDYLIIIKSHRLSSEFEIQSIDGAAAELIRPVEIFRFLSAIMKELLVELTMKDANHFSIDEDQTLVFHCAKARKPLLDIYRQKMQRRNAYSLVDFITGLLK